LNEFPDKGWKLGSIDYLLKKIHKTGTVNKEPGSGRLRSARTDENTETVDGLVLSQDDKPKKHQLMWRISRETGIHCSSVTELMFVDLGVKVNGQYYRGVLSQQIIPAIKQVAGDTFVFQQDSAPVHRARDTIQLLQRQTPDFIGPELWPPNSPDLNPVDYKIWGVMQQWV